MDEWQGEAGAVRAQPGDLVMATDGEVGVVAEVVEAGAGRDASLLVRLDDGSTVDIPQTMVSNRADGKVFLPLARETLVGEVSVPAVAPDAAVGRMLLHEETLEATTAPVRRGVVRVVRRVETVPVQEVVEAWRDDVIVERVPINQEIEAAPAPRTEGETIIVPVVEEVVVSETRLMLREEVRITRRRVNEPVTVEATVRRERVDVVHEPQAGQPATEVMRVTNPVDTPSGL